MEGIIYNLNLAIFSK